jgi:hypothetical protein
MIQIHKQITSNDASIRNIVIKLPLIQFYRVECFEVQNERETLKIWREIHSQTWLRNFKVKIIFKLFNN